MSDRKLYLRAKGEKQKLKMRERAEREGEAKRSPMTLIDPNEEPRQPLWGKGTSIAALRARMDCRELAERDLGKRNCQPQQQPHETRTLLFQPGSLVLALRSAVNFIETEKRAARDEKVSREIGLNLHREEERPAKKHREEGGDRGVSKENLDVGLDVLCSLAMNEIQRIEKASLPREEVEVMRHREEGADGTREEKLNEIIETDRRIYKEDLNVFYKGSGNPPAKLNCEDLQGLITLSEPATREDVDFVDKDSAIPPPKRNWENLNRKDEGATEMALLTRLSEFAKYNAIAQDCNNKKRPSPIMFAAVVNRLNIPYQMQARLLKLFLELSLSAEGGEDDSAEVRPDLSMETGGRPLARTPSESTIVAHNSSRPIFQGSSSKRDKGKVKSQQVVEDKESDGSPSP